MAMLTIAFVIIPDLFPTGGGVEELVFAKNISFSIPITYQLPPHPPYIDLHNSSTHVIGAGN